VVDDDAVLGVRGADGRSGHGRRLAPRREVGVPIGCVPPHLGPRSRVGHADALVSRFVVVGLFPRRARVR
jgi:hypothetical protein